MYVQNYPMFCDGLLIGRWSYIVFNYHSPKDKWRLLHIGYIENALKVHHEVSYKY